MPPQIRIDKRTLAHGEREDHQEKRCGKNVAKCQSASHSQEELSALAAFHDQVAGANHDDDDGYHGHGIELHRGSPLLRMFRAVLL